MVATVGPVLIPAQHRLLDEFARSARDAFGHAIDRIVLFGSRARGDADESSDIDVMVLVRAAPHDVGRVRRELRDIATDLELEYVDAISAPLSLVVLSVREFEELRRRERRIARDADADGIPL